MRNDRIRKLESFCCGLFVRMIYAMADRLLQASLEAKAAKAGRRACDRSAGVV